MTDGAGGRSRRPSPVAPDGPTIWEVRIVSTDRSTAAYLHLLGWFVSGVAAMGFYVWLALVNVNLFLIWPLLVIVGLSIFKCWTAADGPVGSRWP